MSPYVPRLLASVLLGASTLAHGQDNTLSHPVDSGAPSALPAEPLAAVSAVRRAERPTGLIPSQIERIRTAASVILEAKRQMSAQDPVGSLGAELASLRKELLAQRLNQISEGATPVTEVAAATAPDQVAMRRKARLETSAARLAVKRKALAAAANNNPRLVESLNKTEALESELKAIAALPVQEQGQRLEALSLRLMPQRLSEFAQQLPLQPTLTIGP